MQPCTGGKHWQLLAEGTPQAAGLFPDQSEEEKSIVQIQQGGQWRSQSHHHPDWQGRSCHLRGLGLQAGLKDFCPFVLRAKRLWHTVPATLFPAGLRHEQALSLVPLFPVQQLWSHPDSKPIVEAGEGNRCSEGNLSLHTLRQWCFRLK